MFSVHHPFQCSSLCVGDCSRWLHRCLQIKKTQMSGAVKMNALKGLYAAHQFKRLFLKCRGGKDETLKQKVFAVEVLKRLLKGGD